MNYLRTKILAFHILFFLFFVLFLDRLDILNLSFTFLISFLILQEISKESLNSLSFNRIFLIGAYYYLVIFPFFYSLGLIEVTTFSSSDLSLACLASIIALLGYFSGKSFIHFFHTGFSKESASINSYKFGFYTQQTDILIFVLFLFVFVSLSLMGHSYAPFLFLPLTATSIVVLLSSRLNGTLRNVCLFSLLLMLFIYIASVSSSRLELIKAAILSAFLISFFGNIKINFKKIFLFGSFIFLGAIYITVFRTWALEDLGADNVFQAYWAIFERNKGFVGLLVALGDIGIGYDNLIYIIRSVDFSSLLLGSSLIKPLLIFIPRSIWLDKPIDTQLLIVEERYGALSEFGGGTSQSITLVGDFFWNFSFFGVFLGFILFGLVIAYFDKKSRTTKSLSTVFILSIFAPFFFIAWRGSYSSQLIYTIYSTIPFILMIVAHKILKELPISRR